MEFERGKEDAVRSESGEPSSSTGNGSFAPKSASKEGKDTDQSGNGNLFECNICLDTPTDPVVSFCGHLFCWACLHGWLEMKPHGQTCPVCKASVDRDKVVPLYGRNSRQEDPRKKTVPPRPNAHRTEAPNDNGHVGGADYFPFPGFTMGNNGFHMAFGFGSLPLTFFASMLNLNGVRNAEVRDQGLISRIFLWLAVILIIWVIFY